MAVHPVIMPKLGAYTDDVMLNEWLVGEGEEVASGGAVLELETEKTTAAVEADVSGWLHHIVPGGQAVPIGTTVGLIAETREEYDALAGEASAPGTAPEPVVVRPVARPEAAPAAAAEAVAPSSPARGNAPPVSPRARALLLDLGLTLEDAREISGSGPGGRIVDTDVAAWAERRNGPAAGLAVTDGLTVVREIPLRGRRRTIATRLLSSLQQSAQLTSVLELDVEPLVEFRAQLNEAGTSPRIGVAAIIVKLAAAALREHPILNARVTETAIEVLGEINVAVAVDTDGGLVAPVVEEADRLSIEEVNGRIADLAARARDGALSPADLAGGTFTVSNGGGHPVDITTAILNPPQCGILWVGRIKDRPVAVDGEVVVRPTMQACLTFDHRAVDGAPAAAFLGTLEALVAALPAVPA
jgi:pyruvate dehydrogenase E2 component (dihydrolipoamide acetyltransferase)